MSVNYDLYETPNPDKEGEVLPLHARVVLKGSYTAEEIADQVVAFQHMPHAQVVGIIEAISKELRHLLLKGFSVELGDIGYFTLSLSVDNWRKPFLFIEPPPTTMIAFLPFSVFRFSNAPLP